MSSTPFDLDAVEAEATADTFNFTLKGHTFSLPPFGGLDYRVMIEGDAETTADYTFEEMRRILKVGLGDQWDTFDALTLSVTGILAVFAQWSEANSGEPGESDASTRSSKSTGRPSKRTSRSTTGKN